MHIYMHAYSKCMNVLTTWYTYTEQMHLLLCSTTWTDLRRKLISAVSQRGKEAQKQKRTKRNLCFQLGEQLWYVKPVCTIKEKGRKCYTMDIYWKIILRISLRLCVGQPSNYNARKRSHFQMLAWLHVKFFYSAWFCLFCLGFTKHGDTLAYLLHWSIY